MPTVDQAKTILRDLGMPKEQINDRSGLTLLALAQLVPGSSWTQAKNPLLGVTPIMNWIKENWDKEYAPNTRETFRRQTLHQFVEGAICAYNPDKPDRPVNSPKACYRLVSETLSLIRTYDTSGWKDILKTWHQKNESLVSKYSHNRDMKLVPVTIRDGLEYQLSPGEHSTLMKEIVEQFAPRFADGARLIYIGDTGAKGDFFDEQSFSALNLNLDKKGKLPDVILIDDQKGWAFLIEAVTSHGPVDEKRYLELVTLFGTCELRLIFVSAFPSRNIMNKFLSTIAWETEVWVSDTPDHLIHFNGDRFMGPRE